MIKLYLYEQQAQKKATKQGLLVCSVTRFGPAPTEIPYTT